MICLELTIAEIGLSVGRLNVAQVDAQAAQLCSDGDMEEARDMWEIGARATLLQGTSVLPTATQEIAKTRRIG